MFSTGGAVLPHLDAWCRRYADVLILRVSLEMDTFGCHGHFRIYDLHFMGRLSWGLWWKRDRR